ncbi:hypothetical protein I4U23_016900 [Adineta vaga]|nr:hypothetical protein I4U23_016900 [Adineta vaga]
MVSFTYSGALVNWITTINAILMLSSLAFVYCSNEPITLYEKNPLITLFASTTHEKALAITTRIPEKSVLMMTFLSRMHHWQMRNIRESIKKAFKTHGFTEIRPEDLAQDIKQHYEKELKQRAKPNENLLTIVRLDTLYDTKTLETWTKVQAHVYVEIYQKCDDNWISTNKYQFTYTLSIDIKGVSIDSKKGKFFEELLIKHDVDSAIQAIELRVKPVSWDDL